MSESGNARLTAIVEGRVQGVGFRAFVMDRATTLRLSGWVRNRWDGTVELVAEGERAALEKLLSAARRGPPSAFVSNVKSEWGEATGEFTRFSARSTV
jgi:acylphosphatase